MEIKKLIKVLGFEPKENTTDIYIKKYSYIFENMKMNLHLIRQIRLQIKKVGVWSNVEGRLIGWILVKEVYVKLKVAVMTLL